LSVSELLRYKATVMNAIDELGTPLFVLDTVRFTNNINEMRSAFCSRYSNTIISYSFKTNYTPYLCGLARKLGVYAEVVSSLEYELALKVGYTPDKIIYNGPVKERTSLERALYGGSIVNIHSKYEVDIIKNCIKEIGIHEGKVGIRVNLNLKRSDGSSPRSGGGAYSRFGVTTDDGSLQTIINSLKESVGIKVVGLHGHTSTSTRDVATYAKITDELCSLGLNLIGDELEFIDVGGGFYGKLPPQFNIKGTPTYDDYAETICNIMGKYFPDIRPNLIIEPGTSVSADCTSYITKVLDVYSVSGQKMVLVDGSAIHTKPTFHKKNPPINIIKQDKLSRRFETYSIVGFTCMENDFIANNITGNMPVPGDFMVIDNCGAYTIVMSPQFISGRPAIIAFEKQKALLVKRRDSFDDVFGSYQIK
jgi:diaminopimelate decarboxylase